MGADERLYFFDEEEIGIKRSELEEHHFGRSIDRYRRAIEYCRRTGGLWLDGACGSGYGTEMISKVADYVIGMDIEPITIKYAQKHYGKPNIQFRVSDINNLEFDVEGMFDAIIGLEVIEHVEDSTPFLRRAYKILKLGGVVVVTTPISKGGGPNPLNKYHLNELTRDDFMKLTSDIFDETEYVVDDPTIFTTGELTRQIFAICRKKER